MRRVLILVAVLVLIVTTACGGGRRRAVTSQPAASPPLPTATLPALLPTRTPLSPAPTAKPLPPAPTPTTALARQRAITFNDYVSEKKNYVDVVCTVVNFAGKLERVFDLRKYWDRIFGLEDPIRQLNAYYKESFYGQLELRPYSTPQMGDKGYIEITLPGVAQDWSFGWLIGLEHEDVASLDPTAMQKLVLEIMARVVQEHPEVNYQDKFIFIVLNAPGAEYGRGAAGVIPGDGAESPYDLFVGDVAAADRSKFVDEKYFRIVNDSKVVGVVCPKGYTFDDYFHDRDESAAKDQFILGMAMFGCLAYFHWDCSPFSAGAKGLVQPPSPCLRSPPFALGGWACCSWWHYWPVWGMVGWASGSSSCQCWGSCCCLACCRW